MIVINGISYPDDARVQLYRGGVMVADLPVSYSVFSGQAGDWPSWSAYYEAIGYTTSRNWSDADMYGSDPLLQDPLQQEDPFVSVDPAPTMHNSVRALNPSDEVVYSFSVAGDLHNAIKDFGYLPIRPDETYYIVQTIDRGYLLDGAPINVYTDGVWYQGQKELLAPSWADGTIMKPPDSILSLPVVPMPADVAANETVGAGISGGALLLAGGLAFLAWKLIKKPKSRS